MTKEQWNELMKRSEQLIDESQQLRRQLALAFAWPVDPPSPHIEQASPEFVEEANRRGLWKLFR